MANYWFFEIFLFFHSESYVIYCRFERHTYLLDHVRTIWHVSPSSLFHFSRYCEWFSICFKWIEVVDTMWIYCAHLLIPFVLFVIIYLRLYMRTRLEMFFHLLWHNEINKTEIFIYCCFSLIALAVILFPRSAETSL